MTEDFDVWRSHVYPKLPRVEGDSAWEALAAMASGGEGFWSSVGSSDVQENGEGGSAEKSGVEEPLTINVDFINQLMAHAPKISRITDVLRGLNSALDTLHEFVYAPAH